MPPANQGSKAALITWTVIATIFGITCGVLAIIAYVDKSEYEQRLSTLETSYNQVVSASDLNTTKISDIRIAADAEGRRQIKVVDYLIEKRAELANLLAGTTDPQEAVTQAQAAKAQVGSEAANLAAALTNAGTQIRQLESTVEARQQQIEQLQQSIAQLEQSMQAALAEKQKLVDQYQQQAADAQAQLATAMTQVQSTGQEMQGTVQSLTQQAAADLDELQQQLRSEQARLRQLQEENRMLQEKIADRYPTNQLLAAADATVLRPPSQGTLYIDLGEGDQIVRGMTFEVYDRVTGVPTIEGDELPRGKASIEIIRVNPTNSEARVIRTTPGQSIREGDPVANLIYDKNVPLNFRIYGEFDLDQTGRPNLRDQARLVALVNEFGGNVVERLNVNTDVLVLGVEPEVPQYSETELRNPENVARKEQAERRLAEYNELRLEAERLNKPILNQNQFLYFIGYFEQARR